MKATILWCACNGNTINALIRNIRVNILNAFAKVSIPEDDLYKYLSDKQSNTEVHTQCFYIDNKMHIN